MAKRGYRSPNKRRRGRKRPSRHKFILPSLEDLEELPARAAVCYAVIAAARALEGYSGDYKNLALVALNHAADFCKGNPYSHDLSEFVESEDAAKLLGSNSPALLAASDAVETAFYATTSPGLTQQYLAASAVSAAENAAQTNESVSQDLVVTCQVLMMLYSVPSPHNPHDWGGPIDPVTLTLVSETDSTSPRYGVFTQIGNGGNGDPLLQINSNSRHHRQGAHHLPPRR